MLYEHSVVCCMETVQNVIRRQCNALFGENVVWCGVSVECCLKIHSVLYGDSVVCYL